MLPIRSRFCANLIQACFSTAPEIPLENSGAVFSSLVESMSFLMLSDLALAYDTTQAVYAGYVSAEEGQRIRL
jgi:hypothetical protein